MQLDTYIAVSPVLKYLGEWKLTDRETIDVNLKLEVCCWE